MQGAQKEYITHGTGGEKVALALALARNKGEHEVVLALNNQYFSTVEKIRADFEEVIDQDNIKVCYFPSFSATTVSYQAITRTLSECFVSSLQPDVVHLLDPEQSFIGQTDREIECNGKVVRITQATDAGLHQALTLETDEKAARLFKLWSTIQTDVTHAPSPSISGKKRLAFVSPLPPEKTGIATYNVELIFALSKCYELTLISDQEEVAPLLKSRFRIENAQYLRQHAKNFEQILYHIGNSLFHEQMPSLIKDVPGVVVLHDFYLGHLRAGQSAEQSSDSFNNLLYLSHGYSALLDNVHGIEASILKYPVNWDILTRAIGVIVHSQYARNLVAQWYTKSHQIEVQTIPLLSQSIERIPKSEARARLGLKEQAFVICSYGFLGESKQNHRLLNAFLASALWQDLECYLIFVGECPDNDYGSAFKELIRSSGATDRVFITGFTSDERYQDYLVSADIAVQLRTNARGESSGTILDVMNYALPLIVNANGAMAELDTSAVYMLSEHFSDTELIAAIETLWRDPDLRLRLGNMAKSIIQAQHAPEQCSQRYAEVLEKFYQNGKSVFQRTLNTLAKIDMTPEQRIELSEVLAKNLPAPNTDNCIFLDITATCSKDLKTGIERVARALAMEMLKNPPEGYRVEPVYLALINGQWRYCYARKYTSQLLGLNEPSLQDDVATITSGDLVVSLDLSGASMIESVASGYQASLRQDGVLIYAVIFDLLPIRLPEMFPPGAQSNHEQWLSAVSSLDGAMAISEHVANDFRGWLAEKEHQKHYRRPFLIDWFHLGADIENSAPSKGLPILRRNLLKRVKAEPSFLMVGTIEPRKGHGVVLDAFKQLWARGHQINLIIVGAEGWKGLPDHDRRDIPEIMIRLKKEHIKNKHCFYLNRCSDELLSDLYKTSACLIAASYDEGFGLPLIEAAQHQIPIIARDIPIFREVAGKHAYYFSGMTPEALADEIEHWLGLYTKDQHPSSSKMPWLTWQKSAQKLTQALNIKPSCNKAIPVA